MAKAPWLTILGVGDDGLASLNSSAKLLFDRAETIIAPARVLEVIDTGDKNTIPWTFGVSETIAFIKERRGEATTILATGDPMHFGIGATLRKFFDEDEMLVIPSPSGFSLAAAKLGWRLQETAMISLHGRSVAGLVPHIQPGRQIISLTSNAKTIYAAAQSLVERKFAKSKLTILEHIGGFSEKISTFTAQQIVEQEQAFADFNMLAIECIADDGANFFSTVPGLDDDAFLHDGQLTKREVRALTLSLLAPYPFATLWDIGAGCGSIGIEWMRASQGAKAFAIEQDASRCELIAKNANILGTPTLKIYHGSAPDQLSELPAPDAIFIGGGLTSNGLFDACWDALPVGKRLVANAVTVQSEAYLTKLFETHAGDLTRLQVSRAIPVGKFHGWKSNMPVTLWSVTKQNMKGA
ncbi:MAG: precorrin-6y C5,15-methyltransferase (decarboxylating) subunit CbiE [Lentilitoribacter sp.]